MGGGGGGGGGGSGGVMVLDKLPVPGRPTFLDYSRARAYCAYSKCGWGLFGHFFSLCLFSLLSPSLWETARYRLIYFSQRAVKPKTTNQPNCSDKYISFHVLVVIFLGKKTGDKT